jgi:hypothetical protein
MSFLFVMPMSKMLLSASTPSILGEELVHYGVVDAGARVDAAAALAHGVDLVEDDDVEVAIVPAALLLRLGVGEERPYVLLALPHVLAHHLGAVDNLGLFPV